MIKKLSLSLFLVFCLLSLSAKGAYALTLDTIGTTATTGGRPGAEFYYVSNNPTLSGTAAVNSTVTITINNTSYTTTATATGTWTYVPSTLTAGDHTITIAGDSTTITSLFHIGQSGPTPTPTTPATGGANIPDTLPETGALETTLFILGLGFITVATGFYLSSKQA